MSSNYFSWLYLQAYDSDFSLRGKAFKKQRVGRISLRHPSNAGFNKVHGALLMHHDLAGLGDLVLP
jgi:hypothetical protein